MRVWFNKTFSTINAVFQNLRQSVPAGEVTLVCTHNHNNATAFLAADEHYLEPSGLDSEAYLDWCLDFCREQNIDVFWPGKAAALSTLRQKRFKNIGVKVLSVADYHTLSLLDNKAECYATLPPHVARTMEFIAVDNLSAFDRAVLALSDRHDSLCVKPAVSVNGLGFRILDTKRDSITHLLNGVEYQIPLSELRLGLFNTSKFDTLLVMEHLKGPEWSVDCAGKNGQLLGAVQRKKSPLPGHGQEIDNHPDIAGMTERLTAHFKLNGIFNIQFKAGPHGPRLLEINPRPSGGFGMACLAGANLAGMAWRAFRDEPVEKPVIRYGLQVSEVKLPVVLSAPLNGSPP